MTTRGSSKVNLTIRTVEAMRPEDGDRVVWDGRLPGFGVRISGGGTKTFVLKYKINGRQRMMSLGRLGDDITVDQARKLAEQHRGNVRRGTDPQESRDRERQGGSFGDAWEAYCEFRSQFPFGRRGPWKAKTRAEHQKAFKNYLAQRFGNRSLASITQTDMEALREAVTKGKVRVKRAHAQVIAHKGRTATADRILAYLSGFFTWAIARDAYVGKNPTKAVARYGGKPRERVLDDNEFHSFMAAIDGYDGNVFVKAALKLYVFTACRREEILTLPWTDVRLDDAHIRLKDAKGGDRNVPLSDDAIDVLSELPRMTGNPYVICGHRDGEHLVNVTKTFKALLAKAGLPDDITIHDLRRTYGSQCLKAGVDIYSLSKLLGHASVTTTERAYAFMPKEVLKAASQQVAERIREAAAGQHLTVVPLRRPA